MEPDVERDAGQVGQKGQEKGSVVMPTAERSGKVESNRSSYRLSQSQSSHGDEKEFPLPKKRQASRVVRYLAREWIPAAPDASPGADPFLRHLLLVLPQDFRLHLHSQPDRLSRLDELGSLERGLDEGGPGGRVGQSSDGASLSAGELHQPVV